MHDKFDSNNDKFDNDNDKFDSYFLYQEKSLICSNFIEQQNIFIIMFFLHITALLSPDYQ